MRVISLRWALPAAVLAMGIFAAARVDSEPVHAPRGVPVRTGDVAGKVEYCTDCHGPSGQGYHGYLTMPRLAGQTPEYIDTQLRNFADRSRERNLFIDMARVHGLSPDLRARLAAHFRGLDPRPIGGGPRNLLGTGKRIYDEGIPEANIPACAVCHGPDAKGQEASSDEPTGTIRYRGTLGLERPQPQERPALDLIGRPRGHAGRFRLLRHARPGFAAQ
jgi:cytochrome c553